MASSGEERRQTGNARTGAALSGLYLQGLGVLQDYVEAHKWLNLAASRGDSAAVAERGALAQKMTPAQVAQAQELAREWRPSESRVSAASEEAATAPARPAAVLTEETLTPTRDSPSDAAAAQATADSPETAEAASHRGELCDGSSGCDTVSLWSVRNRLRQSPLIPVQ